MDKISGARAPRQEVLSFMTKIDIFSGFLGAGKTTLIKKLIAEVSGVPVPIGPYEPKTAGKTASNAEQSLLALEKLGLEVSIEDTARKKR